MTQHRKNEFKIVTKGYDSSDYKKKNEVSQGLADTHEQVSDSYIVGDLSTDDLQHQERKSYK